MPELYIGLMSGTSLDGVDVCLVDLSHDQCTVTHAIFTPFDDALTQRIRRLSDAHNPVFLADYGATDAELGHIFADTVLNLLTQSSHSPTDIVAIGSHGLTVHHAPNAVRRFSLQIGDPNIIAEKTGITTVADFRRRDMAVLGQGAPLVPAFHRHLFAKQEQNACIVNIGGIANLTVIDDERTLGFDTGPGNTLIDYWNRKNRGSAYDSNGDWAKTGRVNPILLTTLKQDSYFFEPPPKSTGKEYFCESWLETLLAERPQLPPEDIQATLTQLTADTIAEAIEQHARPTGKIILCGGGCHNHYLVSLLATKLKRSIQLSTLFGIDPDYVEAAAFAWLAKQTLENKPGNLMHATGAQKPVVLGGIYPGQHGLNRERRTAPTSG